MLLLASIKLQLVVQGFRPTPHWHVSSHYSVTSNSNNLYDMLDLV